MRSSSALYAPNFYPRPPRGGRPGVVCSSSTLMIFLSTPSARRATSVHAGRHQPGAISIHALREEGDFGGKLAYKMRCDFYPRPPRGGRLIAPHNKVAGADISIHALREEGDPDRAGAALPGHISIHALREEGDPKPARMEHRQRISIHALREEGDVHILIAPTFPGNFYPRPPRGGRPSGA